jgi:toxin ParE1/3/4
LRGSRSAFPFSGRILPELDNKLVREVIHGDYRIVYRVDDGVQVLTVRHAAREMRLED